MIIGISELLYILWVSHINLIYSFCLNTSLKHDTDEILIYLKFSDFLWGRFHQHIFKRSNWINDLHLNLSRVGSWTAAVKMKYRNAAKFEQRARKTLIYADEVTHDDMIMASQLARSEHWFPAVSSSIHCRLTNKSMAPDLHTPPLLPVR